MNMRLEFSSSLSGAYQDYNATQLKIYDRDSWYQRHILYV